MNERQERITYAYYFFSEALIVFLALIPILHIYFNLVPYGAYLLIMLLFTLVFTFFRDWANHYALYLIPAPFLFAGFYWIGLPWLLGLPLSFYFLWRGISLRREEGQREQTYLRWALALSVISAFLVPDFYLVLYLFCLFLILLIGHILRHLAAGKQEEGQRIKPLLWLALPLGLSVGAGIIYILFPVLRLTISTLWQGFIGILVFVGSKLVQFIFFLDLLPGDWEQAELPEQNFGDGQENQFESMEAGDPGLLSLLLKLAFWLLLGLIALYLLLKAYRFFKRRFQWEDDRQAAPNLTYEALDEKQDRRKSIFQRIRERFTARPQDPVRRLVYEMESRLAGTELARRPYETIEEWLTRIRADESLMTYQKVRYGQYEVTRDEVAVFEGKIKSLVDLMEEKNSEKAAEDEADA